MALIPSIFGGGRQGGLFDPFSLNIWDPFESSSTGTRDQSQAQSLAMVNPRIDWKETPEAHIIKADLPGIGKQEVKVEVEEGTRVLQISGDQMSQEEKEEKDDKFHRVERVRGKFLRRFRMPENAKLDQIKASLENGVLTVMVPKEKEKNPEVKSVDISG